MLLALAPPPALREPLEDEEPSESEDELLMLSLSWPRPHDVVAQLPLSGRRLSVGELSEVVSGALLSILAIPVKASSQCTRPVNSEHELNWSNKLHMKKILGSNYTKLSGKLLRVKLGYFCDSLSGIDTEEIKV